MFKPSKQKYITGTCIPINNLQGTGIVEDIRDLYKVEGSGIVDTIRDIYNVGKEVPNVLFGDVGTKLSNMVPDSDENARPLFEGEQHTLLKLKNGRYGRASFMGPKTQVIKRLQRGDPPRTVADKTAKRHDIDYSLALNNTDVRKADERMIRSLKKAEKDRTDSRFNTKQGLALIGSKIRLEDTGLLNKGSFADINEKHTPEEIELLESEKEKLEMEGFGRKLPAGLRLRRKLMKSYNKKDENVQKAIKKIIEQI